MADSPELKADRDCIQKALQDTNSGLPAGSLVTGWVVICEYMDPAGDKWLSKLSHEGSTKWGEYGMLFDGLHKDWARVDDSGTD